MSKITLIASFPRCRTAWLSAFAASFANVTAHHDGALIGSRTLRTPAEYGAMIHSDPLPYVVDVSSGLLCLPNHVAMTSGDIIWINRDPEECRQGWIDHVINHTPQAAQLWPTILNGARHLRQHFARRIKKEVQFSELNDPAAMREIMAIVAPGEPFNEQKFLHFQSLNIQEII